MLEIEFAHKLLQLLPEKALFMPESKTLLVADVHLGKAASLRARNFYAPEGMGLFDLQRISALLVEHAAQRLIVLGDLIHARDGLHAPELESFGRWRSKHDVEMILVMGNHDKKIKFDKFGLQVVKDELVEGPFIFAHDTDLAVASRGGEAQLAIGGHVHPYIALSGKGKQSERLPCFWKRAECLVLPAFGTFTGSYTINPAKEDRVFVVAHDTVVEIKNKRK